MDLLFTGLGPPYKREARIAKAEEGNVMTEAGGEKAMRWGAMSQRTEEASKAGNGKEMDSPLEPPEGTGPVNTLILAL